VILVGDRRPEERHNAVAHDLVHRALEAMDRVDHALEDRVKKCSRLLRISADYELHRASKIGEQHGDLLAFTLESSPALEDLLGEKLRRLGVGRGGRQPGAVRDW
jgi:hypothetical protein